MLNWLRVELFAPAIATVSHVLGTDWVAMLVYYLQSLILSNLTYTVPITGDLTENALIYSIHSITYVSSHARDLCKQDGGDNKV